MEGKCGEGGERNRGLTKRKVGRRAAMRTGWGRDGERGDIWYGRLKGHGGLGDEGGGSRRERRVGN